MPTLNLQTVWKCNFCMIWAGRCPKEELVSKLCQNTNLFSSCHGVWAKWKDRKFGENTNWQTRVMMEELCSFSSEVWAISQRSYELYCTFHLEYWSHIWKLFSVKRSVPIETGSVLEWEDRDVLRIWSNQDKLIVPEQHPKHKLVSKMHSKSTLIISRANANTNWKWPQITQHFPRVCSELNNKPNYTSYESVGCWLHNFRSSANLCRDEQCLFLPCNTGRLCISIFGCH